MRTRVREQFRPDACAGPAQAPVRELPVLRDPHRRRAAPLTAEDTALPGRMLVLLSRLHRSEMQLKADAEAASPQGA
ncbi:hypothetical protein [Methylobacterium frigidaeris]|uniref:Uncharacterized protein n=1 Tax=Methylobacterium frigidaeris TaxID=2038277 RepID=A0AA37M5H7_9HYPH|nr:hypothetical protein [Methylobacterium frigidaeris]PIK71795.1 hypothetical protein CS379_17440 [Methylobacterium frigidaeris]GJD63668.1 hypothetical protein MPEAHAMD_3838 [Methylobacterium frigidaeris]